MSHSERIATRTAEIGGGHARVAGEDAERRVLGSRELGVAQHAVDAGPDGEFEMLDQVGQPLRVGLHLGFC